MSSSALDQKILEELVYFDLFSYPLTTLEVWQNISNQYSYAEVFKQLTGSPWLKARVHFKQGVWSLRGREDLFFERQKRYRASKPKLDKARRFARLAKFIPWVQEIKVCNSLGFLNAQEENDIDFFIIARRGRIWSTRFFMIILAKCFGRPTSLHTKDGLCLSFFAVSGAKMKKVALEPNDVYLRHWTDQQLPLYWRSIVKQRNSKLGNILEIALRYVQLKIMPPRLKVLANKGTGVVLNEEFLKFHDHDKREYFKKQYGARLAEVST